MSEFVRASRLYDVERGERVAFDWTKMQSIAASQAEIERAVAGLLSDTETETTG